MQDVPLSPDHRRQPRYQLAVARAFAEAGDKVAVTFRSGEPPVDLLDLGVLAVPRDITEPEQVEQAFKEVEATHGNVEVLVANAGITKDQLLMRMTEEDFSSVIDISLTGAFRVAKRANRGMLRAQGPRGADFVRRRRRRRLSVRPGRRTTPRPRPRWSASLVPWPVSWVPAPPPSTFAPGLTETAMSGELTDAQWAAVVEHIPLGRLARPEEIAAVVFVASEAAGYIAGAVIPVGGGVGMGH
jgi:3-oxoacyl-[acyl-carrier protein] reductase